VLSAIFVRPLVPKLLGVVKGGVGESTFASSNTTQVPSKKFIDLSVASYHSLLITSRSLHRTFLYIISNNTMMRTQTSLLALFALIAPFVSADLHSDGVCVDVVGGQNVYNVVATIAACTAYLNRNTGGEQWDTCPDCTMVSVTKYVDSSSFVKLTHSLESYRQLERLPLRCLAYWW
jgi:hypothetical protein